MGYILQNLPYFLILIGPLVFFHELGHFLVAKWAGVKVLKFSLGFGPKLVGFTRGDTEYVIAAFPLGGFVKMWGEDPSMELTEAEKRDSFSHQALWKRVAIVAAGPIFNLLLAIVLYSSFHLGPVQEGAAKLGLVMSGERAAEAGLQAGDEVTAIDGRPVKYWMDLQQAIAKTTTGSLQLTILRDGATQEVRITPRPVDDVDELGQPEVHGKIGISLSYLAPLIDVPEADSPAAKAGLQTGDEIIAVNGQTITSWDDLRRQLSKASNNVVLRYKRGEEAEKEVTLAFVTTSDVLADAHLRPDPAGKLSGLVSYDARVAKVVGNSPAEKAGLNVGDRLLSLNGRKITAWRLDLATMNGTDASKAFDLEFSRGKEVRSAHIQLDVSTEKDELKQQVTRYVFGAENDPKSMRTSLIERQYSVLEALREGAKKTYQISALTMRGIGLMVSGKISSSNVGGPVMLFVLAEKSATRGIAAFVSMMAIISINLGIMNLLPVPVLDGGHLVFLAIEGLSRRPVPVRYREYATLMGLVLLFMLMALAFKNDFVHFIMG